MKQVNLPVFTGQLQYFGCGDFLYASLRNQKFPLLQVIRPRQKSITTCRGTTLEDGLKLEVQSYCLDEAHQLLLENPLLEKYRVV